MKKFYLGLAVMMLLGNFSIQAQGLTPYEQRLFSLMQAQLDFFTVNFADHRRRIHYFSYIDGGDRVSAAVVV